MRCAALFATRLVPSLSVGGGTPCVALAVCVLLLTPGARAGDPLGQAFRKASKSEVKAVRIANNAALKLAKAELGAASKAYIKSESAADDAVAAAVDTVSAQRAAVHDAAVASAEALRAAGLELLGAEGEPVVPGRDFLDGGRGVWDAHLASLDVELDKFDDKLEKAFVRFTKAMAKGAKKRVEPLSIHFRFPPHGEAFLLTPSPGLGLGAEGGFDDIAAAQILIAARFLSVGNPDTLELGIQYDEPTVAVILDGETGGGGLLEQLVGGPGVFTTSVPDVGEMIPEESDFLRIALEVLGGPSYRSAVLSQPRVLTQTPEHKALIKILKSVGKKQAGQFSKQSNDAIKALAKLLSSHLKALSKNFVDEILAASTGFCNQSDARREVGFWRRAANGALHSEIAQALSEAGIADNMELPSAFLQDSTGAYFDITKKFQQTEARRQAVITKRFEGFFDKLLKISAKQNDGLVAGAAVVGRRPVVGLPMINAEESDLDGFHVLVTAQLVDAIQIVDGTAEGGGPTVHTEVSGVLDPGAVSSVDSAVQVGDGESVVIGGLNPSAGFDTDKTDVPLLGGVPLIGQFFRSGNDASSRTNLIILVTPMIVDQGGA